MTAIQLYYDRQRRRWQVRYRTDDGSGRRPRKSFAGPPPPPDTRDEARHAPRAAKQYRDHLIAQRERQGGLADPGRGAVKLGAFWREAYWPRAQRRLAPATQAIYGHVWRHWLEPEVGNLPLRKLTPRRVGERLADDLADRGAGVPTIAKAYTVLSAVLTYAVAEELLQGNPVREVRKPQQTDRPEVRPLSPEAVERIRARVEAKHGQRDAVLVGLQGLAGLRPGEALRVEVADFGEGYRTLSVLAPKTKRRRHVRILKPLADDVRAYLLSTGIRSGRLFPAPAGKAEWAEHDWRNWRRRVYQEAAKAEGVTDDMRAYRLRGSFASLLLWETDCQQTDVAKQLGHSLAVLFDRYAGVIEDVKVAKGKRRDAERAVREARAKVAAERARGVA